MKILVINSGSSSLKYQVIDTKTKETQIKGNIQRVTNHHDAIKEVLKEVNMGEISAVGHRVVHGGEKFNSSVLVTPEVIQEMEKISHLAPLHNPANILGAKECTKINPEIPNILVFDTAFHSTMGESAFLYGIPYEDYQNYGIRKYGFHGTSHKFVAREASKILGKPLQDLKLITCHIGNGASICAIDGGISVDTSMGMTPLAGVMMGTRSGDIDPSVLPILCKKHKFNIDEAMDYLNKECGLKGLSGLSSDMRDIEAAFGTNERTKIAVSVFIRKIVQYIGGYIAIMRGCDAIVWTGGIGLHRPWIVNMAMDYFKYLPEVKKLVIDTNEELEIAMECEKLLNENKNQENKGKK